MARSKLFNIVLVSVLLWISGVAAHGRLTVPSPRGKFQGVPDYMENVPVDLSSSAFVCRDQPSVSASQYVTVNAGQQIDWAWSFTALHPGDCFAYISYDGDDSIPAQQKKFFKIAQWAECKNQTDVDLKLTIPSYLPSCDHCIIRFEWYALHKRPLIEYYTQCADIKIVGNANGGLPSPMVYPGNTSLPVDGYQYRDAYNPGAFFFTGPPVATYGGAVTTQSPATTTPAPTTQAPVATTKAPTQAPVTTTPAPTTQAPVATTKAPTSTPVTTTKAPTSAPVTTTKAPTSAPTQAPSSGCPVGNQRCGTGAVFYTCVYTNSLGASSYNAQQNCAPGTSCHEDGTGHIYCQ